MPATRTAKAAVDAKLVENTRRLEAINDGEVLVFGPDTERRAHRLTCKRLPKGDFTQMTAAAAVAVDHATPAGCCKPQLPSTDAKVQARKERHLEAVRPAVIDQPPADAPSELTEPQAVTEPVERLQLAKAEHAILQAWIAKGEKPPRPATPNLDAINAEHAAGGTKVRTRVSQPRPAASGRYAEALAAKKAASNKRGPGAKASAEALSALAGELSAEGLTQAQALEVAYWVNRLAVSRGKWAAAWAAKA